MTIKKDIILILLSLMIFPLSLLGESIKVSVSPQRGKTQIDAGDIFYLYITLQDINEAPAKPVVNGAKLMYFDRTSQQSSFSSINGVTTQSFTSTYTATLRAEKTGSYTYGPIVVGGVKSNQVKYSIGSKMPDQSSSATSSASASPDTDQDDKPKFIGKGDANLFLKASLSQSSVYEQQALVYTVKLYTTYDAIKFIGATAAPKFDGFVVEESKDISSSLSLETYQGKTYATAVIARYIIFPQITGNLKITGNTYTISVDRREYYHDAFWGNMSFSTPLQLNVTPNDLVINVKGLPAPKPADFSGGVGQFKIKSDLKSTSFKSNQAASIVYTVEGTGNLKYVQLPDLSAIYPPELEIYTPKTTQDINVGSSNVSGSVSFDYSFMPLEEGNYHIPDIRLVFFNPETGTYQTSIAKGYDINVEKGAENSKKTSEKLKFNPQLENINTKALTFNTKPIIYKFVYWLWYIIPVFILLIALLGYRRYASLHADLIALNSRRADKIARRRLKNAEIAFKKKQKEKFYDELLSALWGYLGDKLKMPTSELMRDNVRQVLAERGVPEESVNMFIQLIDEAEFAKYSSSKDADNLKQLYDTAVKTINNLEKEFKTLSNKN